jgi:hypothetical protein
MDPIQERQLTKAADTRGQTSWLPKLAKPDGLNNPVRVCEIAKLKMHFPVKLTRHHLVFFLFSIFFFKKQDTYQ